MIRVRVMRFSTFGIPPRHLSPRFAAVISEMQVNAAAENVIRMLRMNRNRISVINLTFCSKMTTANLSPCFTPIRAAENTQQPIAPIAQSVLSESINHVWI